jgi:hypothetical protein
MVGRLRSLFEVVIGELKLIPCLEQFRPRNLTGGEFEKAEKFQMTHACFVRELVE